MSHRVERVLRVGLAFAFLYPVAAAYFNPSSWIGYFPEFIRSSVQNDTLLLNGFGVIEIVIALWILTGWRIFWPSAAATLILLGILIFNFPQMDVIFRDVSILAVAIALTLNARKDLPLRA